MIKHSLNRRTMLRGILGGSAAVVVGLPMLEAMLDASGTALADGSPIPKKFGMWFFGNGVVPSDWNPGGTGTGYTLSPALEPLAAVKDKVSVVTQTNIPGDFPTAHFSHIAGVRRSGGTTNVDDAILDHLATDGRRRTIDVRISRVHNDTYEVSDNDAFEIHGKSDPHELWADLFSGFTPDAEPVNPGIALAKTSVLDAVLADAKALRKRLGKADRVRLDAHLEHIHALEARVMAITPEGCTLPTDPGPRPPTEAGLHEPLEEVNRAMSDLLAYALACDLAGGFRVMFTTVETYAILWQAGMSSDYHNYGHNHPDSQEIKNAVIFTMEQLAYLLGRLDEVTVGDTTVLDHCCIWVTSEINAPNAHGTLSIPTLVCGTAGGALKSGQHFVAPGNQSSAGNHARLHVTMMQALGMTTTSFGNGVARGDGAFTELLT